MPFLWESKQTRISQGKTFGAVGRPQWKMSLQKKESEGDRQHAWWALNAAKGEPSLGTWPRWFS